MTFSLSSEGPKPESVMRGSADFSACERYRWTLWRRWDDALPYVNFVLLNPSTADAKMDDPTMRRCIGYARGWGFGAQCTTNIHAFRATDPKDMKRAADPTGAENDAWILKIACAAGLVVLGFGTHGEFQGRGRKVVELLRAAGITPHCLKITQDGWPCHPLYLLRNLKPIPYP